MNHMKPINILLVEDNEGDIMLTTDAFHDSSLSNKISIVRDGWEAVLYLQQKSSYTKAELPELILLDVNLPKMNGHEVLKFVKTNETIKHIPVIMLTTSSSQKDVLSSYQNHANCYITKPVNIEEYITVVGAIENFWASVVQLPVKN
ncbi:MAG: two-component system response regulator [Ferruginibacter sp.]|nr:two-component system response regulator [Ferruginibacter sp.]